MSRTVAVIGASGNRKKFGNRAVRAFLQQGYRVYPVNPREKEVEGLETYPSVLDVPGEVDMVTMYVPPSVGRGLLEDIAKKGRKEVWFNPGTESPGLAQRTRELNLEPIVACSILAIGQDPHAM